MLADEYFRVAHSDVTGRPRLAGRVLALGLAAGLLGELVSSRHLEVGEVLRAVDRRPPGDAVAHGVLAEILAEPTPRPVRDWLAFLAESAGARVGERLARAGQVRVRQRWGRRVAYVPTDMNAAAMPGAVLSQKLRRGLALTYEELCLAGLVQATGLDTLLLDGADPVVPARLRWALSYLWPPMKLLLGHTQAAVGDAVLSHRA